MKYFVLLLTLWFPFAASAAAPSWKIIPEESAIAFTATQNAAPFNGKFDKFSGEIMFAPEDLANSKVHIVVDMASVVAPMQDMTTMLKADEWLAVTAYPQAIFEASKFTHVSENNYTAEGTLTLRGVTLPTILSFTLKDYKDKAATAIGEVTLKRTAFGVGQGEWTKTDGVKDDVKVQFKVQASRD